VSSYQLLATQTSSTFVHDSHRNRRLYATQNVHSQAVRMSDAGARDSKSLRIELEQ